MAWLKHLRAQVSSASTTSADARASKLSSSQSPTAPVTIIDPTPQDEVDRLLACSGPARGVITSARHDMSDGDRPIRTRVHVSVRPRLHGGALGDEVAFTPWVSWKVAALLEPGLEIPVQLNRTTMRIDAIAIDHLAQELAPRSDEAKRRHPGLDVDVGLQGVSQVPGVVAPLLRPPSGPAQSGPTVPSDDPTTGVAPRCPDQMP